MKCVRCGHDSKLKDRPGRVCPQCRGTFAFEPQQGDPFTDRAFAHAIDVVSAQGTVRFAPAHVYYQLCRQKRTSWGAFAGKLVMAAIVLAGAFAVYAEGSGVWGTFIAVLGGALGVSAIVGLRRPRVPAVSRQSFDTLWDRWRSVHGAPKALVAPRRKQITQRSSALEDELRQYSFDRAVICDKPEVVDVLLANRFHFENNCAVLSVGGYPEAAFETVRAMLRNNPKLVVLTVHDATPDGCTLAHRLSNDPEWFAGRARVIDVGLRPAHAKFFPGQAQQNAKPRAVALHGITSEEAAWLSTYRLDLAVIRPEQLVKRLFKAITVAEAGGFDGGGGSSGDSVTIFGMDTSTTDGGGDSFG